MQSLSRAKKTQSHCQIALLMDFPMKGLSKSELNNSGETSDSSKTWEGLHPGLLKPTQGPSPTWPEHRHTMPSLEGTGAFIAWRQVQNTDQVKPNFHPALFVQRLFSVSSCFPGPEAHVGPHSEPSNISTSTETAGFTPPLAPRWAQLLPRAGDVEIHGTVPVLPRQSLGMSSSSFLRVFWKKRGGLHTKSKGWPRGRRSRWACRCRGRCRALLCSSFSLLRVSSGSFCSKDGKCSLQNCSFSAET